ncbi:MAG: CRTAC1 family protein [Planctomycetaceae bacterium]|nr:CRTAC1 family protein [Planctomycetaceae bacterium]
MLLLLLLAACESSSPPDAPAQPDSAAAEPQNSHQRMVRELEAIRNQARIENVYFEDASLAETRLMLSGLDPHAPPGLRLNLLVELADASRRLGKNSDAVDALLEIHRLLQDSGIALSEKQQLALLYETALTWLRLGESENCVNCRTGDSCILPIRPGGVHQYPRGSREAMKVFLQLLEIDPDNFSARWLLNVAAMTLGEYPDSVPTEFRVAPERLMSSTEFPRFHDVAQGVGLKTINCGGGAVAEDFDNDGLIDILTSSWDPGGQIHLFRNRGDGTFEDCTEAAGLIGILGGINIVQGDFDNDGWTDVCVVRGAWLGNAGQYPNSLLRNVNGRGFEDVTFAVGLGSERFPTATAAWGDYDLDGDLDLFAGNESGPCRLYRNDGGQSFTDVASEAGVENERFTKGAVWGDVDGDGRPDLFVSNLGADNRLYRNLGNGRFEDVASQSGVTSPQWSFPTWFWDVNNDGALDLYVGSYQVGIEHIAREYFGLEREAECDGLYLGDGHGGFRDVAAEYGLTGVTQPMGANFGDLDNDGYPDFYLGTGYPMYDGLMPNLMFHNRDGTAFDNVSYAGGFAHLQKGHGIAFADLDNDGDQDVFIQMGGAYPGDAFGDVLFENPGFERHWLRLKLVGRTSNRSAIGTRIRVTVSAPDGSRTIYHSVGSGGSFGCNPLTAQIGIGEAERIDLLEIEWPASGDRQSFEAISADQFLEIEEHADAYHVRQMPRFTFRSES